MVTTYRGHAGPLKRLYWALWGKPVNKRIKKKEKEILDLEQTVKRKKAEYEKKRLDLQSNRLEIEEKATEYEKIKLARKMAEEQELIDDIRGGFDEEDEEPQSKGNMLEEAIEHGINGFITARGKGKTGEDRGQTKLGTDADPGNARREIGPEKMKK